MSIKSEKAKEYIRNNRVSPRIGDEDIIDGVIRVPDGSFMFADSAQKAVEIAESDAEHRDRDRAVRAFCATVEDCGYDCSDHCRGRGECWQLQDYLKNYDNE